jgi:hypothetical protein
MLRKLFLTAVTGVTLMAPLTATPAAQAGEPAGYRHRERDYDRDRDYDRGRWRRRHHEYRVFYRECCSDPWCCYGCYDCYEEAYHAECCLRHDGYEVSLRD